MNEFEEIFYECEDISTQDMCYYLSTEESEIHIGWRPTIDCEIGRISKLSEVFLEWYLFESDTEKNIKTFLESEGLSDVFTETQFMDLMCGKAYLDNVLLQFVALKLPFFLTVGRLCRLNSCVKNGYLIKGDYQTVIAKIQKLRIEQAQQEKEREKESYRQYRETHHDQIIEYDRQRYKRRRQQVLAQKKIYYAANREIIAEKTKIYREAHQDEIKKRKKQYEIAHKEEIREQRKKYRAARKAEIREKNKKWRAEHPEYDKQRAQRPQRKKYMKEYHKRYTEKNLEAVQKRKRAWYEANKERLVEQDKQRRQKLKQQTEMAQKICAAYVFLLQLRKTDKAQYQMLYRPQQNPLIEMLRLCPALQNMDASLCPLCNSESWQSVDTCCNPKVLALPGAADKLKYIANELKQNKR
ncbi:MAG: hypothetical protein IKN73_01450 [Alphaproteobacteria bacterium]|nr:hypothetical protein [Alphaproteobacteria bacterium]